VNATGQLWTFPDGPPVGSEFASVGPWLHSRGQSRALTAEGVRAERSGGTGSIKITTSARKQACALIAGGSSPITFDH
jgi:hypothetical protein